MTRNMNPAREPAAWSPRSAGAALAALLLVAFVAVVLPGTARAESFQYWSLWESNGGSWQPAQTGASEIKLGDASTFAAKYVETEGDLKDSDAPENPADYAQLCPDTDAAADGEVRVAVVVDFGEPALAPEGQAPPETKVSCVSVADPATAADALGAAASVGSDSGGFVATIDGYPGTAAPEAVTTDDGSVTPATDGAGTTAVEEDGISIATWLVTIVPAFVIVLLIIWAVRRNRARQDEGAGEHPAEQ